MLLLFSLLFLSIPPLHAGLVRFTFTGTVGTPTVVTGTPPLAEGMDFRLSLVVDEATAFPRPSDFFFVAQRLTLQFFGNGFPEITTNATFEVAPVAIALSLSPGWNADFFDIVFGTPAIWTGTPQAPDFIPGTFALSSPGRSFRYLATGMSFEAPLSLTRGGTLVIEEVPEPSTAALLAGAGALAVMARHARRRRSRAVDR